MPMKSDLWSYCKIKATPAFKSLPLLVMSQALFFTARSTSEQGSKVISNELHLWYCRLWVEIDQCFVIIFQLSFLCEVGSLLFGILAFCCVSHPICQELPVGMRLFD